MKILNLSFLGTACHRFASLACLLGVSIAAAVGKDRPNIIYIMSDDMGFSDIGCYTLGILPPLQTTDFVICMGASVSSAAGFSRVSEKKVIAFVGDSTFYHSGITGLVNAVHNQHRFILMILDNGTTAMTGHQPHPGVELVPPGWEKPTVSIEAIVKACGVEHVKVVNPINIGN